MKTRKLVILVLVVLILTMSTLAYAGTAPQPRYTLIANASSTLSINGSGLASCTGSVTGQTGVDSVKIVGYLQKDNGSSWVTVKSWTQTWTGRTGTMYKTYYVTNGSYRFRAYCTAYDGGASETVIVTSYDTY